MAGGSGERFSDALPKVYHMLQGKTVLEHCIAAFLTCDEISAVQVVIRPEDMAHYQTATKSLEEDRLLTPIFGGEKRQESVRLGLEALNDYRPSYVLIHDAARPLITQKVINNVLEGLTTNVAAIPAIPTVDTLKKAKKPRQLMIEPTVTRHELWQAQTPQGFKYKEILNAHVECQDMNLTDDASVCEAVQIPVALVDGDVENLKITTREDLIRANKMLIATTTTRTGFGYDVHAFEDGDHVMLCGIKIKHNKKLKGHSDADVGLHALTDALLGAMALGDIGSHFPPTDKKYKDMDSTLFLEYAANRVRENHGEIINVDITLVCEKPKIAPHCEKMTDRIADILEILPNQVSVKATTSEGLGFTGRSEGIAAHAVANVRVGLN